MSFRNPSLVRDKIVHVIDLPKPSLDTLSDTLERLNVNTKKLDANYELKASMPIHDYISELVNLFDDFKENNDDVNARLVYKIFSYLLLIANVQFIQVFIRQDLFLRVLDVLNVGSKKKTSYRELFSNMPKLDEGVPLNSSLATSLGEIDHLDFLKKNVITLVQKKRFLVDTLEQLTLWKHIDMVNDLQQDALLTRQLFQSLRFADAPIAQRCSIAQLLIRIFNYAQNDMADFAAATFFRIMDGIGFLDMVQQLIMDEEPEIRRSASTLFSIAIGLDLDHIQQSILQQADQPKQASHSTLLQVLLQRWVDEQEPEIEVQLYDHIQRLIGISDVRSSTRSSSKRQAIAQGKVLPIQSIFDDDPATGNLLKHFFARCASIVVQPIDNLPIEPIKDNQAVPLETTHDRAVFYTHLCQLVQTLLEQYGPRMKHVLHGSHLFEKIAQLLRSPYVEVKLHALRVFRACIGMRDNDLGRLLISQRVFSYIIWLSQEVQEDSRSTFHTEYVEFFDFILIRNMTSIITHIFEKHGDQLQPLEHLDQIKAMQVKYQQQKLRRP
ncbi:hypothetical protein DM01DRAFT_1410055 [Hesseltinella vesiculosa]|uniref:Serine/threonine-protein phosphatase 4 regulatory subunit 3-like central domain-containing protein n=1 Tax=Hesseltinella vesiculosa TaxID=101127 RepID=A0A1X2G915_9FUNG|nr:hypothetical protein DM01DRAFT_1410055 [Hesseltinella vesiculosa]